LTREFGGGSVSRSIRVLQKIQELLGDASGSILPEGIFRQ
jgi:hypothetical protein